MTKSKRTIFWATCLLLPLFLLEIVAFGVDWLLVTGESQQKLLSSFPAQIRLSNEEIAQAFPDLAVAPRAGQFLGFDFDPVMGFRSLDALEWYGVQPGQNLDDKYLIVTFGGSTTVGDNWPKYLLNAAKQAGVTEDIIILNAGLWGYMSFNEKIYFSSWILPLLREKGLQPKLILSMDGVNDVWYRILGFFESKRSDSPWYSTYHGFHQHHDNDMQDIKSISGAMKQLLVNASSSIYHFSYQAMPYTMLMVYQGGQRLFASGDYRALADATTLSKVKLEDEVEDQITRGFESTLLDFFGEASVRDMQFVAYLQPVLQPEYYPFQIPENFYYSSIDYMGVSLNKTNRFFTRLQTPSIVETSGLYKKCATMYGGLAQKYPQNFTSLIAGFRNLEEGDGLYKRDAVHYEQQGKEQLASLVVADLIQKQILNTVQSPSLKEITP